MKILLLCNSDLLAVPAIVQLDQKKILVAVAVPETTVHLLMPSILTAGIQQEKLHQLNKKKLAEELSELIKLTQAEAVFVLSFPWKIPANVLLIPKYGFVNFHFGLLPKYKGADPIFWQLKNREQNGGIAVHQMTESIDDGPLLKQEILTIIPGETYGIHCQRLGAFAAEHLEPVVQALINQIFLPVPACTTDAIFFKAPDNSILTIDWQNQTADEIEFLANACNPKYGGAITHIRQMSLRLVEVSPADVNDPPEVEPGIIVYADALYGLIVACINRQFLKINIVSMPEGIISGIKLFNLGFKIGEKFY